MQKRAILGGLSFLLEPARGVVFIRAFETESTIRAENQPVGKAPYIIQLVTNFLAHLAIWPTGVATALCREFSNL